MWKLSSTAARVLWVARSPEPHSAEGTWTDTQIPEGLGGADLGVAVDDAEQERHLKVAETPLQTPNPRSPDYIQLVGSTMGGHLPFVLWMRLDAGGVVHTHAAVRTPLGWHDREVAAGIRVRDMERVDPLTWRVYATTNDPAVTAVSTYTLTAGVLWRPEATIPTPRAVQRVEVVDGYRDPARVILTGASSARPPDVADGDVYVAGAPAHRPEQGTLDAYAGGT
jgi:hypothetical protein